jgi:hypothetical protein
MNVQPPPGTDEEMFNEGIVKLERMRRDCMAFVAEHYEPTEGPISDEEYVDSWHDPEYVWSRALDHVLGTYEMWHEFYQAARDERPNALSDEDVDTLVDVMLVSVVVFCSGMQEVKRQFHEARLFGHVEEAAVGSPEWVDVYAFLTSSEGPDDEFLRGLVAFHLLNVRDGLCDATGAFLEFDDEED